MINLLEPFRGACLSKMMVNVFPWMLQNASDTIIKFMDTAIYQPPQMERSHISIWPEDKNSHIFVTSTSIISSAMVNDEMKKVMGIEE